MPQSIVNSIFGDNGQGAANAAAANASGISARASEQLSGIAQDQWNTYKTTFSPSEKALVADATASGSAANIAQEGAIAGANATQQAGLADAAKTRALTRSGVNPNSGNGLALAQENANTTALATTGAINTARKMTKDTSFAKLQDTVNAGNKVSSNATAGLANASNGAANAAAASAKVSANAAAQNQSRMGGLSSVAAAFLG